MSWKIFHEKKKNELIIIGLSRQKKKKEKWTRTVKEKINYKLGGNKVALK